MLQDLRYALRALIRAPGFTTTAVLTLALGIGANTAMFTVVHAVLLKPLPYRDADRLVRISEARKALPLNVSYPNFLDWRARSHTLEDMATYYAFGRETIGGNGPAEAVPSGAAEARLFSLLGVEPVRGRLFAPDEEKPGGPPVVLISYRLWQRRFAGADAIVGHDINLVSDSATVVGVLPADFRLTGTEIWFPLGRSLSGMQLDRGNHPGFQAFGRLRAGATIDDARREMSSIASALERDYPETNRDMTVVLRPMLDSFVGRVRPMLLLLTAAVTCFLLIACANLANVLLARGLGRERETSVRAALGAGRFRLARLFLAESITVSLAGGAAGLLLATWSMRAVHLIPGFLLPRSADVTIDFPVLAFAVGVSCVTSLVCGLAPALHLSRVNLMNSLRQAGGGSEVRGRGIRNTLVAVEVALSLVLLVGAGLMVRTLERLSSVDPGYRAEGLLALNTVQNTRGDGAAAARFVERLVSDLQSTPGVAGAAAAWPLDSSWTPYVNAIDRPSPRGQEPAVQMSAVVPSFFSTMGIPLRRGRVIDARDRAGAAAAVVVNETLVRRLLPPGDPIGRRLSAVGIPELSNMEIVGVVGDTLRLGLAGEAAPEVYCSYAQLPAGSPTVIVRASGGDPLPLGRVVASRIASVDPSVATFGARRVTDSLSDTVGDRRLLSILLGIFAALALALTGVGIAGVVAFVVARRRWEIGVRMALGADASSVVRTVVGGVLIPVSVGLACGLVAAVPFTRAIQQYLFGVSPADPSAIAAAAAALLAAAFIAALVPALRAARVDPLTALRG